MSMNRSVEDERLQVDIGQAFREHWVLFLVEGIVLLILGVLAVVIPPLATLAFTVFFGLLFVTGQYVAWSRLRGEGLYLATNPSSSFFYLLTAAHVLHVLGGLVGLLYVIGKLKKSQLRRSTLDAASRYWHFMDILWVYLLLLLWMKL